MASKQKRNTGTKKPVTKIVANNGMRWFKLLICFVAVFAVVQICQQLYRYNSILKEVDSYKDQLAEAQADYDQLQEQKKLLSNDSYIEKIAREELGMVKEGEVLVALAKNSDVPTVNKSGDDSQIVH